MAPPDPKDLMFVWRELRLGQKDAELQAVDAALSTVQPEAQRLALEEAHGDGRMEVSGSVGTKECWKYKSIVPKGKVFG